MEKVNSGVVFATTIMTFLFSILARVVESTVYDFAEFTNLMIFILTKNWTHTVRSKDIVHSVRPKPGFGIINRNQDQVSVSGPKLFLPIPKLPPLSFLILFSCFLCFVLDTCQVIQSNHDAFVQIIRNSYRKCQIGYKNSYMP